jgi:hypothetical protein
VLPFIHGRIGQVTGYSEVTTLPEKSASRL